VPPRALAPVEELAQVDAHVRGRPALEQRLRESGVAPRVTDHRVKERRVPAEALGVDGRM
jgi:hypothetical protein